MIVPDLRGHGESDTPANKDFSDAAFASDVIAVLDDRGISSAHVFGYSLGGWVVFELAAEYPSRIRTAVVGGAHPYEEDLSALRALSPEAIFNMWESLKAPWSEDTKRRLAAFNPQVLTSIVATDRVNQTKRLERFTDGVFDDLRHRRLAL